METTIWWVIGLVFFIVTLPVWFFVAIFVFSVIAMGFTNLWLAWEGMLEVLRDWYHRIF